MEVKNNTEGTKKLSWLRGQKISKRDILHMRKMKNFPHQVFQLSTKNIMLSSM